MNRSLKKKWVAALRSGAYPQTQGALRRNVRYERFSGDDSSPVGFCCLGVLCEIAKLPKVGLMGGVAYRTSQRAHRVWDTELPDGFRRKIGITKGEQEHLANMNDKGTDFNEIADYIEENL